MVSTTTIALELPLPPLAKQREQLQRTVIRHLLLDGELAMPDALALLSADNQTWLVETLIRDAEEALLLAAQPMDALLRDRYWQQYHTLLGYLFAWHEHWSAYHSQLLSALRMAARRYAVQALTPERAKVMRTLTRRLLEDRLYREDVFSAEHALQDVGWDTLLNLAPIANELFTSYAEELGRA